jgi:phosphate transport system permease protein
MDGVSALTSVTEVARARPGVVLASRPGRRYAPLVADRVLDWALRGAAVVSGLMVVAVVVHLALESVPLLARTGVRAFLFDAHWAPTAGAFGIAPMLAGTLALAGGAIALATPLAVLLAVFLNFYASPVARVVSRRVLELLGGVPGVFYGLWGLVVLVPIIRRIAIPGQSLLAGLIVLTLMILPTIALLADAAVISVPTSQKEAAAALGLGRWATARRVVLPAARSAIATAGLLGAGRAVGETMAVLMVTGNTVRFPTGLFSPMRALTANIALEMSYATGDHRQALFVCGLFLLVLVMGLVAIIDREQRRCCDG